MLRSSTLQMKLRDSEIHRLKLKLKSLGVDYKNPGPLKVSYLPKINESSIAIDSESMFKEPSKLDKLNELSQQFKRQQEQKQM